MLEFNQQLQCLLLAPYPYILVRSWEERGILELLDNLAQNMGRPLVHWDTLKAGLGLREFLDLKLEKGSISVLTDAHPYLDDPLIVRRLRELEEELTTKGAVMVFVSPFFQIPPELVKDFTSLDAPLPNRQAISAVLEEVFPPPQPSTFNPTKLVSAALGLTLREARRAFARARIEQVMAETRGSEFEMEVAVVREKRRLIETDRCLEFVDLVRVLNDVGGLEALKNWLSERELALSPQAAEFGLPAPKGLLLTGVQGCGKSLFAKSVAGFWGIPLLRLDIGRLFDGSSSPEATLLRAIQTAEALAPAVLWIDEIDKAFSLTDSSANRLMGSLLGWLQDKSQPVFVVATANRVAHLPPELLRKGRFDEIFFLDLPDKRARMDILKIHIQRHKRSAQSFDLDSLADASLNFSGAELEQLVVAGLYKAFAQQRELQQDDLKAAISETVPLYRTYEEEIKALRQWAEARARPAAHDRSLLDLFRKS